MQYIKKTFSMLSTAELYQIMKARVDVFIVEQECLYPELDNHDQQAVHIYLQTGSVIVAYARLLPKGTAFPEVSIGRLLVVSKYRGNGYAEAIMRKAIIHLSEQWDESVIKIQAQTYLHAFYSSLGFNQITEAYLEDGIPHIDMIWKRK